MAKFYGKIGYVNPYELSPGVFDDTPEEYPYYGDVLSNYRNLEDGEQVNGNIAVNNMISIVADSFAFDHFFAMAYIWWMGTRWQIRKVEVKRPRLILTLGGVYNGPEARSPEDS